MARPQKQTVDYFPHDANTHGSDTLTVLQSHFGNDGYAFWFKLLEKLASTEGHFIDCRNPAKWQVFVARMNVPELSAVEMMKILVEMQAVDVDLWKSRVIWCQHLVDNITSVYKNRRQEVPQKPVITDDNLISTTDNAVSTTNLPVGIPPQENEANRDCPPSPIPLSPLPPQSKVEESRVEESKEEEKAVKKKKEDEVQSSKVTTETEFLEYVEETRKEFPDLDCEVEFKKFTLHWSECGKKLKMPKKAWYNWLIKAREIKGENARQKPFLSKKMRIEQGREWKRQGLCEECGGEGHTKYTCPHVKYSSLVRS